VDGKYVPMVSVYKVHGYNYFRLRDIAAALKDTKYSFSVGFDAESKTVYITTGKDYTLLGTELKDNVTAAAEAIVSGWKLMVNGVEKTVSVYNIDGYNYYKLRDLAAIIGFGVDYNDDTNTAIITTE
jgi:hypothetical protein